MNSYFRLHLYIVYILITSLIFPEFFVSICAKNSFFSSPGPKVQVNYCHHLASVVCCLSSVNFSHFKLLLRNHWADWNQTQKPNCPGMIIGRSSTNFCFLCQSEIQDGRHHRTQINIGPCGKIFKCLLLRNYKYD